MPSALASTVAASLCVAAYGSSMSGFGSSIGQDSEVAILHTLRELYAEKLRPLERKSLYHLLREPVLGDAWFDSKPMVLLIGQYSVGKTSFIRYLLGRDFPGAAFRIGPEPTTERFVAIMYGDQDKTTPGNALTSQPDTPFHSLKKFGTNFLDRLESTALPAPILKRITMIDTPGVLNGEKQRSRGYDYEAVIKWFAQHSDRVLLLFDAHKTDIGDEFRNVVQLLREHASKVRVVLNKADSIPPKGLLHVYGAMMWSLGGVVSSPEAARVYIGSFWDQPWQHTGMQELMESDEVDLVEDLACLPENNAISKINEIARRCRLVQAHAHLMAELRARVKSEWFSRKSKQDALLASEPVFRALMEDVQRKFDLSPGDFPSGEDLVQFATRLQSHDFTAFYAPSSERSKKLRLLQELMEDDVPNLISRMHTVEKRTKSGANREKQWSKFRPPRLVRPARLPPTAAWAPPAESGGSIPGVGGGAAAGGVGGAAGGAGVNVLEAFKQRAQQAVKNTLGQAGQGGPPWQGVGAGAGAPPPPPPQQQQPQLQPQPQPQPTPQVQQTAASSFGGPAATAYANEPSMAQQQYAPVEAEPEAMEAEAEVPPEVPAAAGWPQPSSEPMEEALQSAPDLDAAAGDYGVDPPPPPPPIMDHDAYPPPPLPPVEVEGSGDEASYPPPSPPGWLS